MKTYVVVMNATSHSYVFGTFDVDDHVTDDEAASTFLGNLNSIQRENASIHRCEFGSGQYQPRMARPKVISHVGIGISPHGPLYSYSENLDSPLPHDSEALATALNQLSVLTRELTEVMRHIEPVPANMRAYGQITRSTLITAAMEVENEFRGVLSANGYVASTRRLSTNDFVKLKDPLRLKDYSVSLPFYPQLGSRQPFKDWIEAAPSASLPWYDSYNAVKHNRSESFHRATLANAVDSVIGFAILLAAQYRIIPVWRDQIGDFFKFDESPRWEDWRKYVEVESGWTAQPYLFP